MPNAPRGWAGELKVPPPIEEGESVEAYEAKKLIVKNMIPFWFRQFRGVGIRYDRSNPDHVRDRDLEAEVQPRDLLGFQRVLHVRT